MKFKIHAACNWGYSHKQYNKDFYNKLGINYKSIILDTGETVYTTENQTGKIDLTLEEIVKLSKTEPLIIEWNSITIYDDYIE